jgi:peptidoglycan biosynthesis protein MviN/MurJ (putative lipid II flippase)
MLLMGHAGLAAASSFGAYVNLLGLLWAGRRRFGRLGGRALAVSLGRTAAACAPLAAWCLLLARVGGGVGLAREASWLGVTIAGGAVLYLAASALLKSPERVALWGMLPWRRRR